MTMEGKCRSILRENTHKSVQGHHIPSGAGSQSESVLQAAADTAALTRVQGAVAILQSLTQEQISFPHRGRG